MKIALAQVLSTSDPQHNLAIIRDNAKQAAAAGASIVVFPEAMQVAFGNPVASFAEPVNARWAGIIRQQARDLGITIVAGMFTPGENGRVRNTLLAAGRGVDTHYDKIHLFDAFGYQESDAVTPGDAPVQFELDGTTIGLAICYDLRFPRLFLTHAKAGAKISIVSASWGAGPGKAEQWKALAQARAMDTTTFVVAVDQADPESVGHQLTGTAPRGVGYSMVVDPLGQVIAQAGREPELLVVDLDLDLVDRAREKLPVLKNMVEL
ncbi:carbon-nitrogen hydrolase family protein [Glutamicibacter sp.]|uniref:carbon-nitrogen hydrolase family protein n=1 Tax=Glutamicibacter sp. TaxID=1931995 RepID=UPI0028BDA22E|nr:carbon-nitrogen hydrolase family protein [Glutamicibacter sp.]